MWKFGHPGGCGCSAVLPIWASLLCPEWAEGWPGGCVGQIRQFGSGLISSLAWGGCNQSQLVFRVETVSALSLRIRARSLCLFRCKMCLQPPCPNLPHYHPQLPVKLVIQKSGHAISEWYFGFPGICRIFQGSHAQSHGFLKKTWESTEKWAFCNRHGILKHSPKQKASTKYFHCFNSKTVWRSENHKALKSFYFFLWPWEVGKCWRNWGIEWAVQTRAFKLTSNSE